MAINTSIDLSSATASLPTTRSSGSTERVVITRHRDGDAPRGFNIDCRHNIAANDCLDLAAKLVADIDGLNGYEKKLLARLKNRLENDRNGIIFTIK